MGARLNPNTGQWEYGAGPGGGAIAKYKYTLAEDDPGFQSGDGVVVGDALPVGSTILSLFPVFTGAFSFGFPSVMRLGVIDGIDPLNDSIAYLREFETIVGDVFATGFTNAGVSVRPETPVTAESILLEAVVTGANVHIYAVFSVAPDPGDGSDEVEIHVLIVEPAA